MSTQRTALSSFCSIVQGGRHGLSGNDFTADGYPAYGAGGLNGLLPSHEFDAAGIVLSSIGARCGKCFLAEGKWSSLANTQVIMADPVKADIRFLWHQLNDEQRWPRSGTAQPFIRPSDVKGHTVLLPSLPEQRRIAALLDKADAIRRKRQEAIRLADDLAQSLYVAIVGPTNPDYAQWPIRRIEQLAGPGPGSMRTGPFGSALRHSEFVDEGIAVLGIDNAVQNRFTWDERRFITPEKYAAMARYTVKPGDVIITIMGTTGRSAVVPNDVPVAISTKHLATITVDRTRVHPEFLSNAIHRDPLVVGQLQARNRGAIMSGLNLGLIRSLELRLPPLSTQERFAAAIDAARRADARYRRSSDTADRLFGALTQQAFQTP